MTSQSEMFESQPDMFGTETAPQYRPDPEKVRARLHNLLAEARGANVIPWSRPVLTLYKTIFPEMSRHLPEDEAKQLCFEFEAEIARLEAA
ncbi:MAG TPA: hypothetical protein VG735_10915 [Caulobacterales bacterium]|jgi:hypothetical protein|nr:hypothetical protein [Caulobacterales bacterium]